MWYRGSNKRWNPVFLPEASLGVMRFIIVTMQRGVPRQFVGEPPKATKSHCGLRKDFQGEYPGE
jgi:hypothetical protein